jgi:hypothetical protein
MHKKVKISFIVLFIIIGFFIARSFAQSSGSSGDANLTIWDGTDSLTKYSECSEYCGQKGKSSNSYWNVRFYSNYTNSTGSIINETFGNGNCSVRFNETGVWSSWFQMHFNKSLDKWKNNNSFSYKGNLTAQFNCTSDFGNISLYEDFFITNTVPYILTTPANYIDFNVDGTKDILQCVEDTLCIYNFSTNVSEDDGNDALTYGYEPGSNTTLTNFSLNSSTSILEINVTNDADAGSKKIELNVRDTESSTISALLDVDISEVNDAPLFSSNLANQSFNITNLFEIVVNVTDEENNIPFSLNISFMSCSVASWSDRNCSNSSGRELFNSSQYDFNSTTGKLNISFVPEKNDVGSYIINFSVKDTNNNVAPYNASNSKIINFTILNVNSAPYFRYVCDDERNSSEDSEFICRINATDIDENNNLTLTSNYGWFKFGSSDSNSVTEACNSSTSYNISAIVNFTASDTEIGNWSINITIRDTGNPQGVNSSVFWFFIDNVEDLVELDEISNLTIYENNTFYINATDDDLLVPDSSVKDESLSFSSNETWVDVSTFSSDDNYTTAKVEVNYNYAFNNYGEGNYTVKINVSDTGGNYADRNFTIEILGDNVPVWNETMQDNFTIYENNVTYLNFSLNVTDADGDDINFSSVNDTAFLSFGIDEDTGIINFTAVNEDVGQHIITITASDNKLSTDKIFNFTIYNINEAPYIETPLTVDNASVDVNSNVGADEDNYTTILLWAQDDDFRILEEQKGFYNESLVLNLTIQGPNTNLFTFVKDPAYPTSSGSLANKSKYEAIFTPNKSDVGSYNITINITDQGNLSEVLEFNLTVQEVEHSPNLMNLTNHSSAVNRHLYYDINSTDVEEKNDSSGNLTYKIDFLQGDDFITNNESIFNTSSGILDIVFNLTQGGTYQLNISVNDTEGLRDEGILGIYVYDFPNITFPNEGSLYNLTENETLSMIFRANHSVGNNLTYDFLIDYVSYDTSVLDNFSYGNFSLRESLNYYGNNTNLSWQFTPNYTEETYGKLKNLTLRVYPSDNSLENNSALNTTLNFKINISHKNSPLSFSGNIGGADKKIIGSSPQSVSLSDYFSDADASDAYYYQKVTFDYELINSSGGTISVSITNWINGEIPSINFSSSEDATANYSVKGYEYNISNSSQKVSNVTSNNFTLELSVSQTKEVRVPSLSGGGSSQSEPVSLKIILPDPVSAYKNDVITLPIKLSNTGETDLNSINLSYLISKNGSVAEGIRGEFTESYFESLEIDEEKNTTLTIYTNTNELGLYEITINASVESPEYHDWGKIYLTVREANKSEALEKILFTEEFIAENPECIEIKEVVEEAREYYEKEFYSKALEKAREAINSCRYAITQAANPQKTEQKQEKSFFYKYLSYSILFAVFLSVVYYFYKRIKLRRRNLNQNVGNKIDSNPENLLGMQEDTDK